MRTVAADIRATPYQGYAYSYPHKSAYRPFHPAIPLTALWAREDRRSLFLYLHVPFCEFRCGFCNLFTLSQPDRDLAQNYLRQLRIEAERVRNALGDCQFARLAIGGGTPTYLSPAELGELLAVTTDILQVSPRAIPVGIETSPATADDERLDVLQDFGVDRISIGIQSFIESETSALGRPQSRRAVDAALGRIRERRFPCLNIDLIYGGEGQTVASWLDSLRQALAYEPEELYLYPLYVRPLTGLGSRAAWDDERLSAYRAGRDLLREAGYSQVSMRMFRRAAEHADAEPGPPYACQRDGMVGIGCGARSYTREVHYSTEFAVGKPGVRSILLDYLQRPPEQFDVAAYGVRLDGNEQRRRFALMSLLQAEGLSRGEYRERFTTDVVDDFPELAAWRRDGWLEITPSVLCLTETGMENSDAIGPGLYSDWVRRRMGTFECQ